MTRVGDIGIGLLILIILWIATLIILVQSIRAQNNVGWIILTITTCITVTLVIIPTDSKENTQTKVDLESDYAFVYKTATLTILIISAILACICFFFIHCVKPIHPKLIENF